MDTKVRIVFLDPGGTLSEGAAPLLRKAGYQVRVTRHPEELETGSAGPDLVVVDGCSQGPRGVPRVVAAVRRSVAAPILQVSGCAVLEDACRCHPSRADAFLLRPLVGRELLGIVARLAEPNGRPHTFQGMVGASEPMAEVFESIRLVASTEAVVLVSGETGTGKELVARAIHGLSTRADGPFVAVDCAALPASLLESELFGHVKGAFTGADRDMPGLFQASDGGTLLLDEVGDMPMPVQMRLLRAVQEREIRPVGATTTVRVDNRIVAATRRDLGRLVERGEFREDLYYRLRGFLIELPPLRSRTGDVEPLVRWWLARRGTRESDDSAAERTGEGGTRPPVSAAAMAMLRSHRWPGNVRELFAVLEHARIRAGGGGIGVQHLPPELREAVERSDPDDYRQALASSEIEGLSPEAILAALHETGGHRRRAARRLGISRTTLWRRMKAFGLTVEDGALPPP